MSAKDDAKKLAMHMLGSAKWPVPLPTPSSVMREDLDSLKLGQWYISRKLDGVRTLAVISHVNGSPYCVLVDRAGKMSRSKVRIRNKELYAGTILDAELMGDTLHVFDIYSYCGYTLEQSFNERQQYLKTAISEIEYPELIPKEFLRLEEVSDDVFTCDACDGVVLVNSDHVAMKRGTMCFGRQFNYFKLKPTHLNTVDVMLASRSPNGIMLDDAPAPAKYSVSEFSKFNLNTVIECKILKKGQEVFLSPLKPRPDKKKSNSLFVFEQTIKNILENITPEDLKLILRDK